MKDKTNTPEPLDMTHVNETAAAQPWEPDPQDVADMEARKAAFFAEIEARREVEHHTMLDAQDDLDRVKKRVELIVHAAAGMGQYSLTEGAEAALEALETVAARVERLRGSLSVRWQD